ncbi:unnamed protein product [Malus baccata var. baccata]
MVVLSPSFSLFTSNHLLPSNLLLREQGRVVMQQNKWQVSSSANSKPSLENGVGRRELLMFGISAPVLLVSPSPGSLAEADLKMAPFFDEINSYSYLYPMELPSKKALFKWVESRKPERYSSAAPLSPDARLRIVSERVDIVDNLIISISIGPPNSKIIKSQDKSTWTAKDVADSVLADKSALATVFCSVSPQLSARLRVKFLMHTLVKLMVGHTGIMSTLFARHPQKLLTNLPITDTIWLQQLNEMNFFLNTAKT